MWPITVVNTKAAHTATVFVTEEEYKTDRATNIPPSACNAAMTTTRNVHPWKIFPFVSYTDIGMYMRIEHNASWMFLSHTSSSVEERDIGDDEIPLAIIAAADGDSTSNFLPRFSSSSSFFFFNTFSKYTDPNPLNIVCMSAKKTPKA